MKKYLNNAKVIGCVAVRVVVLIIPAIVVLIGWACEDFMEWSQKWLPAGTEKWEK